MRRRCAEAATSEAWLPQRLHCLTVGGDEAQSVGHPVVERRICELPGLEARRAVGEQHLTEVAAEIDQHGRLARRRREAFAGDVLELAVLAPEREAHAASSVVADEVAARQARSPTCVPRPHGDRHDDDNEPTDVELKARRDVEPSIGPCDTCGQRPGRRAGGGRNHEQPRPAVGDPGGDCHDDRSQRDGERPRRRPGEIAIERSHVRESDNQPTPGTQRGGPRRPADTRCSGDDDQSMHEEGAMEESNIVRDPGSRRIPRGSCNHQQNAQPTTPSQRATRRFHPGPTRNRPQG